MERVHLLLGCSLCVCGCVFLSLSLSVSSNMLTAHSAGLISLLILCESRLINTHLWQISTANCDRHSASSHYLIISAWCTHSKQCSLPVCLSLSVSDLLWHSQILTYTHTHNNTHTHTDDTQTPRSSHKYDAFWSHWSFRLFRWLNSWLAGLMFLFPLIIGSLQMVYTRWCLGNAY